MEAAPSGAHKEAILSFGPGTNLAFVQVCVNGSGGSSLREGNRRAGRLLSKLHHNHHPPTPYTHSSDTGWHLVANDVKLACRYHGALILFPSPSPPAKHCRDFASTLNYGFFFCPRFGSAAIKKVGLPEIFQICNKKKKKKKSDLEYRQSILHPSSEFSLRVVQTNQIYWTQQTTRTSNPDSFGKHLFL